MTNLVICTAFIWGVAFILQIDAACQSTEVSHAGKCYYFGTNLENERRAHDICKGRGGYLASINSADENNFLKAQIAQHGFIGVNAAPYLIGGSDEKSEGTFAWEDGTQVSTFTDWGPGQPDNYLSAEDCMIYYRPYGLASEYKWADVSCDVGVELFICERSDGAASSAGKDGAAKN